MKMRLLFESEARTGRTGKTRNVAYCIINLYNRDTERTTLLYFVPVCSGLQRP